MKVPWGYWRHRRINIWKEKLVTEKCVLKYILYQLCSRAYLIQQKCGEMKSKGKRWERNAINHLAVTSCQIQRHKGLFHVHNYTQQIYDYTLEFVIFWFVNYVSCFHLSLYVCDRNIAILYLSMNRRKYM